MQTLAWIAACSAQPPADPTSAGPTPVEPPAPEPSATTWRSALYPEDWTPAFTADEGSFLHDFSYAGYHRSERDLPDAWPGPEVAVTAYGASDLADDNTAAFQAAIDAVAAGGVVTIPDGTWRFTGRLRVASSGVLLRGAGRDTTRLYFTTTAAENIAFEGAPADPDPGVALIEDGLARQHAVVVADPSGFAVGDDVRIDWTITQAFIDAHAMQGIWDADPNSALDLRKTFFRREIVAIDGDLITLDVPLRYPALLRDGATLRRDPGALEACGIEHLSIANAADPAAALANPRSHAVSFTRVKDCFVRDVASFDPDEEPSGAHLASGGIAVVESKRVTVTGSAMAHAQNRGDGGAGYGFEASMSNEVLFVDDLVEDVRHGFIQNWDFGASGIVWLRCTAVDDVASNSGFATPGRSELHHRLAMANLFDSTRDTAGFAAYNRGSESSNAGHAGTETVFWNVSGEGRLSSYQAGRGYVIGTTGLEPLVVPDLIDAALQADAGTAPVDWLEGVDEGESLVPSSLFTDQLARRLESSD